MVLTPKCSSPVAICCLFPSFTRNPALFSIQPQLCSRKEHRAELGRSPDPWEFLVSLEPSLGKMSTDRSCSGNAVNHPQSSLEISGEISVFHLRKCCCLLTFPSFFPPGISGKSCCQLHPLPLRHHLPSGHHLQHHL